MFIPVLAILYFCFCTRLNLSSNSTDDNSFNKYFKSKLDLDDTRNTGLDERVSRMSDIIDGQLDYELLSKIDQNFYKQRVLNKLINPNITEIEKINILNRYLLYFDSDPVVNIYAGGLLDDWEFEIK